MNRVSITTFFIFACTSNILIAMRPPPSFSFLKNFSLSFREPRILREPHILKRKNAPACPFNCKGPLACKKRLIVSENALLAEAFKSARTRYVDDAERKTIFALAGCEENRHKLRAYLTGLIRRLKLGPIEWKGI